MVNYYDKNKFISKRELARLACVSDRTFSRYLASRRHVFEAMGNGHTGVWRGRAQRAGDAARVEPHPRPPLFDCQSEYAQLNVL